MSEATAEEFMEVFGNMTLQEALKMVDPFGENRLAAIMGEQPDSRALPADGAMRGDRVPSHEPQQGGGES